MNLGRELRKWVARGILGERFVVKDREPTLGDLIRSRHVESVIDVGANVGQFANKIRSTGYSGPIVSFEPIPEVFKTLTSRMGSDANWRGENMALGAHVGEIVIHVSASSEYSSIKSLNKSGEQFGHGAKTAEDIRVKIDLLDNQFSDFGRKSLLKIDTQGFEKEVLLGAQNTLRNVEILLLELPCINIYDNVWSMSEALSHIESLGFFLAQVSPVSYAPHDRATLVEIDCAFCRVRS